MSDSIAFDIEQEMSRFREGGDDHFYGAWHGGSKADGGGPGGGASHMLQGDKVAVADARPPTGSTKEHLDEALKRVSGQGVGVSQQIVPWDATAKDIEAARDFGNFPKTAEPNTIQMQESSFGPGIGIFYGGNGKPVGAIKFTVEAPPNPYFQQGSHPGISEVMVAPSQRGKGYGFKMYDYVQDHTSYNLYDMIGQSHDFTPAGKAFAQKWLEHRVEMEGIRSV